MTALTPKRPVVGVAAAPRRSPVRRFAIAGAWLGAACAAMAVIVSRDGSPAWRLARVMIVVAVTLLAVMLWRSGDARRRATVTLVVGIPAFVTGAGVGVPHAAAGLSLTSAAGLVALMSGLGLLATAFAGFWRSARRWGRVVVVLTAFVVAQWVLFPASAAVLATNRAPLPLPARSPADIGLQYRDVTLTAKDGVSLAAWYVPSRNGAAVVLLHGAGSTRVNVLDHAEVLARHDYGVLLVDARGHGDSGGDEMDFGWYGDADTAPAVAFLTATPDVAEGRIAVVGMSMGGEEAIGAAAAVPTVRAVVAEGATGRTGGDWLPLRPAGVGRWFSAVFYWVQDTTADLLSGASRPIELSSAVVAAAPRPMLLITGATVARERTAGRRLRDVAPDRVELWEVSGAGHTAGLATAPEEWERTVIEFLDRTVRR